ncbi:MAG TPA: serine/threonine-protein kinase [Terriglobales bacterium]|nr:serine/threonine-protein kinase [Terriglobales bacterium]
MDNARWQRIQTLFHEAADLPSPEQHAFLSSACNGDDELLADVLAMLETDAHGSSVLDQSIGAVAHNVLAEDNAAVTFPDFGAYRVTRVLGEGGMGVVYLAERKDLGTVVAIKALRDAWLSPARRVRFASEQRTLAQLNHPSIARLYDADVLPDGTPWFVMEYVEGLPLTDYCVQHQCSIEQRLQLFRSVCEAVEFAHTHAVIHRDLKPSNILVKEDGSVRLLDFGIAKQLESLETPVTQTMTGLRLMTPAYAAPEQVRGDRVGTHTDVYSLGVIFFELLAGRLPLDLSNLTPMEAATVVLEHDPGKPSSVSTLQKDKSAGTSMGKAEWADLDVLCLTAMHKEPERRYRSVEALIRDVDHYLKGEPLEARPDTLLYRTGKFIRRNQRAAVLACVSAAVLLGMAIFFTVRLTKARNQALAEAARTLRIQKFMMNLFEGGDQAVGPADSLRVVTLVDQGVLQAKSLSNDPRLQSELYQNLGSIYEKLGRFDQADSLLQSALQERKSIFGPASVETADTLLELGLLRDAQSHFDEADQMLRQALDIQERKLPADHPTLARTMSALGKVLEDRGSYAEAIRVLQNAAQMQSANGGPDTDLSETLTELANCHFYSGHYAISESLNQQVLAMDRKLYGDRHPHVADDLINLGAIQYDLGNYAAAEPLDRQALEITQAFYGKEHPATASALTILGRTLVSEGKWDEAALKLQDALSIEEHVYGKVHPKVAGTLNELGKVAQQRGKLDDAEADFTRMADIYKSVYAGKHYYIGIALSNLAGVYIERKNYNRAEQLFREALGIYAQTLPADHLNVGIAHVRLGRALLLNRHEKEAEAESRAGYDILVKQKSAPAKWLQMARTDLAQEYEALRENDKAARFRSESSIASDTEAKLSKTK